MAGLRRLALLLTMLLIVGPSLLSSTSLSPAASGSGAGHWRLAGCFKLQNSVVCRDVFADASGSLWICDGCGRTKNPSPGKCRKLSAEEVAAGTWCNGGS